jgi:hypothetical protein
MYAESVRPYTLGLVFSVLAILFGQFVGIAFGAAEDSMKAGLAESGAAALETVYGGDEAAMDAVVSKSWSYYKRAHLHANAMGTTAVALILLLGTLPCRRKVQQVMAVALGVGSLGYGVFWLLAGMRAPGMGGTDAAKESLNWLAMPSSGMFVIATVVVLVMTIRAYVAPHES